MSTRSRHRRRKHLRRLRPKPPRLPIRPPFPSRCADPKVDGALLRIWQDWLNNGCCGIDDLPENAPDVRNASLSAARASATTSEGELGDLARRPWPWVRLTVAANEHVSASALWGDGVMSLGLCGDDDPYVRAAAILAHPEPPQAVVDAIMNHAGGSSNGH